MLSDFFDYKSPDYHGEDSFGLAHIIFMVLITITLVALPILLRKTKHKNITNYLKVMSFLMVIWETVKIIWESSHYIRINGTFEWGGLLPLYLCSMFIYVLPFAGFAKGKVRRCALAFLTSLGILGGLSNLYFPNILNDYPFFSYATFVSLIYHFLMAFTGIWLLVSNYFVPDRKDYLYGFIPTIIFSIIVIPIAYSLEAIGFTNDYMLYLHAWGLPGIQNLADILVNNGLQGFVTVIVFILFFGLTVLAIEITLLIKRIIKGIKDKKASKETYAN